MLSSSNPSKGNKKGITEIIQQVIAQDPELNKPGIEDSIIQILEYLLTGQQKQKGNQDGLTKTVIDVVSGTPFIYGYTYDNEDKLTSVYDPVTDKTYSYAYDMKGNLTSKQDYYGNYSYTWDYNDRLTAATTPSQTIKYNYDSKDRRTKKVVNTWTPSQAGSDSSSYVIPVQTGIQTTISYQYDEWSVLKETHEASSGSYTVDYSYKDDDTPQAITLGDSTYYYLTDGHGDVREITDKQGNTLVKYSYNAFGSISTKWINPSSELQPSALQLSAVSPYTYSSYRYDSETGFYYLRARFYDPITGRFLSKDPILKESITKEIKDIAKANPLVKDIADELISDIKDNHPYAYAKNNPVNYVDTDGLWKAREHSKQTLVGALNVGFPYDAAEFMALMNFNFDVMYNAVAYPKFHFGRLNARQPKSHAYRYGKPWKHKHCRQRDYRVQYAIRKHNKAVYWKRRNGKYSANAIVQLAYGLHAIQDTYAHLDATPWQHMWGKHRNHYDETWWKPKRVKRSKRATKNYLRWYKNS